MKNLTNNAEKLPKIRKNILKYWNTNTTNYYEMLGPEKCLEYFNTDKPTLYTLKDVPKFDNYDQNKGTLLFLQTIRDNPGIRGWKNVCLAAGQKPTSFNDLRAKLIYDYNFISHGNPFHDYWITEFGKQLLDAYGL